MLQLTEMQLLIVALVASTIVWLLKMYSKTSEKWNPNAGALSVLVYAVSYLLAFFFGGFTFPPFPHYVDPLTFVPLLLTWITQSVAILSTVSGVAILVYNIIWKKVLEWTSTRVKLISVKLSAKFNG